MEDKLIAASRVVQGSLPLTHGACAEQTMDGRPHSGLMPLSTLVSCPGQGPGGIPCLRRAEFSDLVHRHIHQGLVLRETGQRQRYTLPPPASSKFKNGFLGGKYHKRHHEHQLRVKGNVDS